MAMGITNGFIPPAVVGVGSSLVGAVAVLFALAVAVGVAVGVGVLPGVGVGFFGGVSVAVGRNPGGIIPPAAMVGVG